MKVRLRMRRSRCRGSARAVLLRVLCGATVLGMLGACSPEHYVESADKDAYKIGDTVHLSATVEGKLACEAQINFMLADV